MKIYNQAFQSYFWTSIYYKQVCYTKYIKLFNPQTSLSLPRSYKFILSFLSKDRTLFLFQKICQKSCNYRANEDLQWNVHVRLKKKRKIEERNEALSKVLPLGEKIILIERGTKLVPILNRICVCVCLIRR